MTKPIVSALLALLLQTPMAGYCFSAGELKSACDAGVKSASGKSGFRSVGDAYEGGLCTGYIHGISDSIEDEFCPPAGTTVGNEVVFVRKYLSAHPERVNEDAETLIRDALSLNYPCPDGDTNTPEPDPR